jgi:PKHD-type hydroxylase
MNNWPLLKTPKENTGWTWREHVFTDPELDRIVAQGLGLGINDATVGVGNVDSYRASGISWMSPEDPEHDWIYATLEPVIRQVNEEYFNFDLTHILPLQFTTYNESNSGHYKPHLDIGRSAPNRKLSFSLQLSDPFSHEGGTLQFPYNKTEPEPAPRARGKIIFFPSYMLHEVTPVTQGTRYSLVGWIAGPLFR